MVNGKWYMVIVAVMVMAMKATVKDDHADAAATAHQHNQFSSKLVIGCLVVR